VSTISTGRSPHLGCGRPTTATSATSGNAPTIRAAIGSRQPESAGPLGEIHFDPVRSVVSASLPIAASIATRTKRLHIGSFGVSAVAIGAMLIAFALSIFHVAKVISLPQRLRTPFEIALHIHPDAAATRPGLAPCSTGRAGCRGVTGPVPSASLDVERDVGPLSKRV